MGNGSKINASIITAVGSILFFLSFIFAIPLWVRITGAILAVLGTAIYLLSWFRR